MQNTPQSGFSKSTHWVVCYIKSYTIMGLMHATIRTPSDLVFATKQVSSALIGQPLSFLSLCIDVVMQVDAVSLRALFPLCCHRCFDKPGQCENSAVVSVPPA